MYSFNLADLKEHTPIPFLSYHPFVSFIISMFNEPSSNCTLGSEITTHQRQVRKHQLILNDSQMEIP